MSRLLLAVPSGTQLSNEAQQQGSGSHGSNVAVTVVAVFASLAVVALLVVALYYLYIRYKSKAESFDLENGISQDFQKSATQHMLPAIHISPAGAQVFTYKQLQFATNNFSSANLIGNGGFGSVYRGVLSDGRLAAIKQLDRAGKQGDHEFRVEVDLLSRLHAPYLLDLLGYCADQDHRLLV
eukprot:c21250_g2_i1 orf=1-543(-)